MHHPGTVLAVALVSALPLTACGSRVTSLDPDKTLSSLSVEDRRRYCEDQFQYTSSRVSADQVRKITCASAAGGIGVGDGSDTAGARAACQQAYQACLSVPAAQPQSACETFPTEAQDCAATVGEATRCTEAQTEALAKQASEADDVCKDVGQPARADVSPGPDEKTRDCARVELLCPKLFSEPAGTTATP